MILKIFTIYDQKAEAFMGPYFEKTKGLFLRGVGTEADNPNSNLCKYGHEMTVYELGEFNDNTAELKLHDTKVDLGFVASYKSNDIVDNSEKE